MAKHLNTQQTLSSKLLSSPTRRGSVLLDSLAILIVVSVIALFIGMATQTLSDEDTVESTVSDFEILAGATRAIRRQSPSNLVDVGSLSNHLTEFSLNSSTSLGLNPQGYGYEVRSTANHVVLSTRIDDEPLAARIAMSLGAGIKARYFSQADHWVIEYWLNDFPPLVDVVSDKVYQRLSNSSNRMTGALAFSQHSTVQRGAICLPADGVESGGVAFSTSGALVVCKEVVGESHRRWQLVVSTTPPVVVLPPIVVPPVVPPTIPPITPPINPPVNPPVFPPTTPPNPDISVPRTLCSDGVTLALDPSQCPTKSLCSDGQTEVYDTDRCPQRSTCPDGVTKKFDLTTCPTFVTCNDGTIVYPPDSCPSGALTCSDPASTVVTDISDCPSLCSDQRTWKVDQNDCPKPTRCWSGIEVFPPDTCPPKQFECSDPQKTKVSELSLCPKLCSDQSTWVSDTANCPSLCPDQKTWRLDLSDCPVVTVCWDNSIVYPPAECPPKPVSCWDGTTVIPPDVCRPDLDCPGPKFIQINANGIEKCVCSQTYVECYGPGNYCSNPVTIVTNPGGSSEYPYESEGGEQRVYYGCDSGGETGF